jgi:predicted RNA binding protein YcfA (HicA-like mRNA interferase family)
MGKKEKLLDKALNNPSGLSFDDFCTLMLHQGWVMDHQRGSHQIWYSPKSYRLSVQNRDGKAKGYQVKQFLTRLEEEGEDNA